MKYREAFAIGSVCDGMIKCTFATIYDESGMGLFSLQRKDTEKGITWKGGYSDNSTWNDAIIYQAQPNLYFVDSGHGGASSGDAKIRGAIGFDMPLVQITEISSRRLVPAKLTEEAIEIIIKACTDVKVTKFNVWRIYDSDKYKALGKERKLMEEVYYMPQSKRDYWKQSDTEDYHHEIESERVISPKYVRLAEVLQNRETVYIKPDAFEWNPTDTRNASVVGPNGKAVNLEDKLAAAKKKVETAKALLVGAGATIFI